MGDTRKPFFDDRPLSSLRSFSRVNAGSPAGLVEVIESIDDPSRIAVVIGDDSNNGFLIPEFFKSDDSGYSVDIKYHSEPGILPSLDHERREKWDSGVASRRLFRNAYFSLSQPEYIGGRVVPPLGPREVLRNSFDGLSLPDEQLFTVGYKYKPIKGREDTKWRLVPLTSILGGAWIVAYLERNRLAFGDVVSLVNEFDASRNGASIDFKIPSRSMERDGKFYKGRIYPVPVCDPKSKETDRAGETADNRNKFLAWSLRADYPSEKDHPHNVYWSVEARMRDFHDFHTSGSLAFSPHCVAAVLESQKALSEKSQNSAPFDYSPIMVPSRALADFYMLLRNNVLVYDPSAKTSDHLRQLNNSELSVLLMRKVLKIGYEEASWNSERDGKLTSYYWCFPEDKPKPPVRS